MSRPALATVDDVAVRLGQEITDPGQAQARLEDASEIVRAYAGTTWLNDDEDTLVDVPAQVAGVVAQMVERAARNPSGVTQETTGPFAVSFGAEAAARLYLTRNNKLVIRAAVARTSIGTLSTSRGPLETPSVADPGVYEEVIWP